MQIIEMSIDDLKPYENNPRKNRAAIKDVAASIREFGFKVPIVVDSDNVIVAGHTRYEASKLLGLETVPCIIADDLTEDQVKAFRLADNKVSEKAKWDDELLKIELGDIDLDMSQFGFDIKLDDEEEEPKEYGAERERTGDAYNLSDFDPAHCMGAYDMPLIDKCTYVPSDLIGFNYVLSAKDEDKKKCVHFFIDDYQFERIWNDPATYIDKLREFDAVFTPDFSLYMDMPKAMQIWNIYRARLIGQLCQSAGIKVIPTVSWSDKQSFTFCFDGLPQHGTIAVSTVGVMRDDEARELWIAGMDEALTRLQPKNVILYGSQIDFDFRKAKVYCFDSRKFN